MEFAFDADTARLLSRATEGYAARQSAAAGSDPSDLAALHEYEDHLDDVDALRGTGNKPDAKSDPRVAAFDAAAQSITDREERFRSQIASRLGSLGGDYDLGPVFPDILTLVSRGWPLTRLVARVVRTEEGEPTVALTKRETDPHAGTNRELEVTDADRRIMHTTITELGKLLLGPEADTTEV